MRESIVGISSNEELQEYISENFGLDLKTYPEYFEAFVGVVESKGSSHKVCYDYNKCLEILSEEFSKDLDDEEDPWEAACEWMSYNTTDAYNGEDTPAFLKIH